MSLINANNHTNVKSKLALALIASVRAVREDENFANIQEKTVSKEISNAINSVLKANFKVTIDPTLRGNAYVYPPSIDKNSPLWRQLFKDYFGDELESDAKELAKKSSAAVMELFIDAETGEYSGPLSKVEVPIVISWDLCVGDRITAEEASAVICHEIGHADTMYRSIGWTVRSNIVLNQFHRVMMGNEVRDTKVEVLSKVCKQEGLPLADQVPWIVDANDPDTAMVIALGAMGHQQRDEMGACGYEARNFEALADTYANRHGLGNELVIGLSKLPGASVWVKESAARIAAQAATFMLHMSLTVMSGGVWAVIPVMLILSHDPEDTIYDPPADRAGRIVREQIISMQQRRGNLTPDEIDKLKTIQNIADMYVESDDWVEFLNEALTPSGRRARAVRQLQQSLERLAANPLFVKAAEFENLN